MGQLLHRVWYHPMLDQPNENQGKWAICLKTKEQSNCFKNALYLEVAQFILYAILDTNHVINNSELPPQLSLQYFLQKTFLSPYFSKIYLNLLNG